MRASLKPLVRSKINSELVCLKGYPDAVLLPMPKAERQFTEVAYRCAYRAKTPT